jgi:scyllo-inositol 2-dehydrogenase (NADP+)
MEAMSAPIRTAVIGYGLAGRVFHCPFVSAVPGLELAAIMVRSSERSAAAATAYPQARVVPTPEELFTDDAIDLIVVATPNDSHVALATAALRAGKHVVVDKPLAPTSAEARALITLATQQNKVLAPFHNRRYDSDFLTVKKLVAEGTLGRIVQVIANYDRFRPLQRPNSWKESGGTGNGLLFDLGPHLVDQALALFGAPVRLTASVRADRDKTEIDDAFDIVFEYESSTTHNLRYECHATMLAADPSARFRVHGTNGSYTKQGLDPQEATLLGGAKPPPLDSPTEAETPWLRESESAWGTLTLATQRSEPVKLERSPYPSLTGDYRLFYANVLDAILGHAPLAIPAEDGYRTIRLLELAIQSSRERRTLAVDFS